METRQAMQMLMERLKARGALKPEVQDLTIEQIMESIYPEEEIGERSQNQKEQN